MRIAMFTASMGGAGHLMRAMAIHAGLARAGFDGKLVCFGPAIPYPVDVPFMYRAVIDDPRPLFHERDALASLACEALAEYDPDLLLVDHFWAGIHHIAPTLRGRIWLLVHSGPRTWLVGSPRMRFERRRYERLIATEPLLHQLVEDRIEPIVVCNPDEMQPRATARRRLGGGDRPLCLVTQTGMEGELEKLRSSEWIDPEADVVSLSLRQDDPLFPAAPWFDGADQLIGGGGYNFFWETRWLGQSGKTRYRAFDRTSDLQTYRVEKLRDYRMKDNGADQLARQILQRC